MECEWGSHVGTGLGPAKRGENPPYSYYSFYIYVNLCRCLMSA